MSSIIQGRFGRRAGALGVAAACLAAAAAWADDTRLTRDPAAARAWLSAHTDIDPGTVVLLGEGYAFAATPGSSEGVFVVREEVSSPVLASALGGRSAAIDATLDCRSHQSSIGGVRVYPENGLRGEGRPLKATAWLRSTPVDLADLAAALCDPAAPRPLASQGPAPAPEAATAEAAPPPTTSPPVPDAAPPTETPPPPPLRPALADGSEPGGAYWAQLGAFAAEALAEAQWAKAQGRVPALAGVGHRIEAVDRSGGKLYRLLAGPYATPALAARACAAVRATGGACLAR